MSFGGHPLQLALVLVLAAVLSFRGWDRSRVAFAAGRLSFVLAAAWMLFGEDKRWWPAGQAIAATGTWALSGWLIGLVVWILFSAVRPRSFPAPATPPQEADGSV